MSQKERFPHDAIHKSLFGYKEILESLLKDFVSEEFVKGFDFDTLEICDTSYTTKYFSSRFGDMVWRVKWHGTDCYIGLLLEFQNRHENMMALRILEYSALFLNNLVKKGTEFALVFFGKRAEFGHQALYHHLVIYRQQENAVFNLKKVFQDFQNLHGDRRI